MEIIMLIAAVCLLVLFLVFLIKYTILKKQIKSFSEQVKKREDKDYDQPIKVDTFDNDIIELAAALNRHTEIQRNTAREYEKTRNKLNGVISGISHDFRTPLTSALGYLQMLEKSSGFTDKQAEYLSLAISKSIYLKELSDDFFELSKTADENSFSSEKINLSNMLSDKLLELYNELDTEKISAEINIDDGIIIYSDPHCIERMIENILSNSRKYMLSLFGARLYVRDDKIILSIYNDIDSSMSIDPDSVFDRFYRSDPRSKNGSGIGLYVVRQLADSLNIKTEAFFDDKGYFTIQLTFNNFNI
ncbi:MAG: HAMP domain-containing histidine kinase [Oscillospiraceae bacterium]|nr:HAMP domain-containing histidine kinase [Oscillospiraceae bacterium]